jgi:nucleoside-diphosphate-sugar epimerase
LLALVGGKGFIANAAARALAAAGWTVEQFGREGPRQGGDLLVWAAGRRAGDLEEDHVRAPVRAAKRATRVVYLSSGEVYGAQTPPFSEDAPLLGDTPYARAKIAGEQALAGATILRPSVAWGPGQEHQPMLIPSLLRARARREVFRMTAGEQTRDFVHVDDVASAIVLVADQRNKIFNAGTGIETRVIDVARALLPPELLDAGAIPYRENEQMRYALESSRLGSLGWSPRRFSIESVSQLTA